MKQKEKLTLGSHFTYKNIFRQSIMPIFMMFFVSIYGIVDGMFISAFDGADAFAGVNLILPIVMIIGGMGFMFGSGGSALASKFLGEKKNNDADKTFSMMLYFSFIVGIISSVITFLFIDKLVDLMANISTSSTDLMKEKAVIYGRILVLGQPLFMLQNLFQNFFVVDEKPNMGFIFTLAAGISNIIFDALFIVVFKLGVIGAATGTILGYLVGTVGPIIYFFKTKNNLIHIVKTKFDFKIIGQCAFNGLSDFIFNISANIMAILYNIQLLKFIGQDGINAYGVILYISFIFISVFVGLNIGMAPVIGYNYGAKNKKEMRNVIKKLLTIIGVLSVIMVASNIIFARSLASLFCHTEELINLTTTAIFYFSFYYLFCGFCILITGTFTALNNGLISGIIALFRNFIFQILFLFVMPLFMGELGIWLSMVTSELTSFLLAVFFLFRYRKEFTPDPENKDILNNEKSE